jgi:hypothetical protein
MQKMFVPHRRHTYGPPSPFTEIAVLFYVDNIRNSQETKYGIPRPVTGRALYFRMYMLFVPQRRNTYMPTRPFTGVALYLYM